MVNGIELSLETTLHGAQPYGYANQFDGVELSKDDCSKSDHVCCADGVQSSSLTTTLFPQPDNYYKKYRKEMAILIKQRYVKNLFTLVCVPTHSLTKNLLWLSLNIFTAL